MRRSKRTRQVVVEKYKLCFDKIMRALVDSEVVQKSALLMSLMVSQTGLIDELSARGIELVSRQIRRYGFKLIRNSRRTSMQWI